MVRNATKLKQAVELMVSIIFRKLAADEVIGRKVDRVSIIFRNSWCRSSLGILLGLYHSHVPKVDRTYFNHELNFFKVNIQGWNESEHIEGRRIIKYEPT
ncbi:hypothetical protein GBA52_010055 [Prunus armeniaca]|nr:hypothetical protein GBA52_010055 [Prunus armeniaca]